MERHVSVLCKAVDLFLDPELYQTISHAPTLRRIGNVAACKEWLPLVDWPAPTNHIVRGPVRSTEA
jgi:hypothetical protein